MRKENQKTDIVNMLNNYTVVLCINITYIILPKIVINEYIWEL